MEKLTHKEHDFSTKLRQASVIERLKQYVAWQRSGAQSGPLPGFSPLSINLDLTAACNFACPHCVDAEIVNTGTSLDLDEALLTVEHLQTRGLLSVILLGGGEPTLYRHFEEIVSHIKARGLQLGIVTNGTQLSRVARIAPLLEQHDWIRLSLDAASQATFVRSHRPKLSVSLEDILISARDVKRLNPRVSLGYSFVIVWEGLSLNGAELCPNIEEMAAATQLAGSHGFDYISFKPCLVRLQGSHKEALLDSVDRAQEYAILAAIQHNLRAARQAAGQGLRILESVNLQALLSGQVDELKRQPRTCHMQYFKSVVAPAGIFHCPAFRGVARARIADSSGYAGQAQFSQTMQSLADSIARFDAAQECSVVGCFYHHVNWWLDNLIRSRDGIDSIAAVADDNFFF